MTRINESHECQRCGMSSDNFATLFFGEHLVFRDLRRRTHCESMMIVWTAPEVPLNDDPISGYLYEIARSRIKSVWTLPAPPTYQFLRPRAIADDHLVLHPLWQILAHTKPLRLREPRIAEHQNSGLFCEVSGTGCVYFTKTEWISSAVLSNRKLSICDHDGKS